jgi:hypothetical protein
MDFHILFSKYKRFINLHKFPDNRWTKHVSDLLFVLHNQSLATDSKSDIVSSCITIDKSDHIFLATKHSKNKLCMDSFSLQNKQGLLSIFFLLATLFQISNLFGYNNHKKIYTPYIGGTFSLQTAGKWTCCTPLKFIILYKYCNEYTPKELWNHLLGSKVK